jgi:unsaturated chondroitin disaccharide hydrolase
VITIEFENDKALFEQTVAYAAQQVRRLVEKHADFYPMYTKDGKWKHEGPAWTHWCDGFLPGMMWLFHKRLENGNGASDYWLKQAIRYTKPLEPRKFDRDVHDLGFIFLSTYYRWYQLTKDPALNDVLIEAGRTMSLRFREKGQYLRSFVAENSLFIDIMMNVGIIFYAARETGDKRLRDIAIRHTLTTRRVLVRGDGSTAHEGIFDTDTGEFLKQTTQQGYRGDSCWSRGLAWALYGFGTCYEYSRDPRFLETAEACADFYIMHTLTEFRHGISARRRKAASCLTLPPPPSPPADCCVSLACCTIRSRANSTGPRPCISCGRYVTSIWGSPIPHGKAYSRAASITFIRSSAWASR